MVRVEQQRMAALCAHIFMAPVAIGELFVIVLAQETRQRVTNVRDRAIFGKVLGAAPARALLTRRVLEQMVIDVVAPDEA